jgi:hypothetical protein
VNEMNSTKRNKLTMSTATKVMLIICSIGILMMIPAAVYHERRRIKDAEETERYSMPVRMGRKYGSPVRPSNLH